MRAKPGMRIEAERLRRDEGLSYNEIAARLGLSKSTLSHWLRDIPLRPELAALLQSRLRANRAEFAERAWPINRQRYAEARAKAYCAGAERVAASPKSAEVSELALAMLYLGEGSKSGNRVQMANTDARIVRYFVQELLKLYDIGLDRLTYRLNLVEAARAREDDFKRWWSNELRCPMTKFTNS